MPHVDEGMLHAYLDGALDALLEAGALPQGTTRNSIEAHLAVCADCRALLEVERTIRTRAGAVLDAAAPVIEVPPFSELVASSRARRPRRRVWPMAWAASVLLAVGAGWWGSELFRNQAAYVARAPVMSESAPAADRAMVDAVSRDGAEPQPVTAPAAPPSPGAGASLQDAATTGGAGAGERRENARAADESSAGNLAAAAAAQQARPEAEAARVGADTRAARADTGRTAGALGRVVTSSALDSAVVAARPPLASAAPTPPPSAPPPAAAEQQRAPLNLAQRQEKAELSVDDFRRSLNELDAGRVPLSAGALPADLPLVQIDGGSAPTVQRGSVIGAALARITQRAPTGAEVEMIVWRPAALDLQEIVVTGTARGDTSAQRQERQRAEADRAQRQRAAAEGAQRFRANAAAPIVHTVVGSAVLPDGRRELLLRRGDGTVLVALRARASAAELQALADRLVDLRRD